MRLRRIAKTIAFLIFVFLLFLGGSILFSIPIVEEPSEEIVEVIPVTKEVEKKATPPPAEEKHSLPSKIVHDVPFTSQAPFGEWGNPRFQDGCEEASIFMAGLWSVGKSVTQKEAHEELLKISSFGEKKFGFFEDTSSADTAEFFKDYFDHDQVRIEYDISVEDIKIELASGSLVLTPMQGERLINPYYTPPGPERHFLLIRGYDDTTGEFITNDPGTRRGEGYRYKYDILFAAILDYPSGKHKPLKEERKAMIVVGK